MSLYIMLDSTVLLIWYCLMYFVMLRSKAKKTSEPAIAVTLRLFGPMRGSEPRPVARTPSLEYHRFCLSF